jgi:hypothetical protein
VEAATIFERSFMVCLMALLMNLNLYLVAVVYPSLTQWLPVSTAVGKANS